MCAVSTLSASALLPFPLFFHLPGPSSAFSAVSLILGFSHTTLMTVRTATEPSSLSSLVFQIRNKKQIINPFAQRQEETHV